MTDPPAQQAANLIVDVQPVMGNPPATAATNPTSLALTFAVSVGFVVLADWLFWGQPRGWTLGAYGLLLTAAVLVSGERSAGGRRAGLRPPGEETGDGAVSSTPLRSLSALFVVAALAGLMLQCAEEPGALPITLGLLGLATLGLIVREGWTASARTWAERWGLLIALGWCCVFRDLLAWNRHQRAHGGLSRSLGQFARRWLVPILLAGVFCVLFTFANAVISRWLADAWRSIRDWLQQLLDKSPSPARIFFWFVVGGVVWTLLRFRSGRTDRGTLETTAEVAAPSPVPLAAFVVRCLALFNAIFALQTALDIWYLWGGAALPPGLTYAQYAHRGAYPLIAAAILAAIFVLAAFGPGRHEPSMRWARRLVYVWLAQNLFLVISAGWRLRLYVDAYSLTRLRVAAAIWMLLVLFGLTWILVRIAARRSNAWLLSVNTFTALVVLYACCFVNFDGFIADFNASHCAELRGSGPPVDVFYLQTLGPEALPALVRLRAALSDPVTRLEVNAAIDRLSADLQSDLSTWRGWTWRRHRLAQATWAETSCGTPASAVRADTISGP